MDFRYAKYIMQKAEEKLVVEYVKAIMSRWDLVISLSVEIYCMFIVYNVKTDAASAEAAFLATA